MAVETSDDALLKQQIGQHARVIVKYYADWCGSCKLFSPEYKKLSNDERFQGITFLDVNAEGNPESRKMAGVNTLPFFATFKDGQLLKTISTTKAEALVEMLREL